MVYLYSNNLQIFFSHIEQATTNVASCELLMVRSLQTCFDMLRPSTEKEVCDSQAKQKQQHDEHVKERSFSPGQSVWARDFCGSTKWVSGVVVQCTGPLTYMIQLEDKSLWKRHVDHLLKPKPALIHQQIIPNLQINLSFQLHLPQNLVTKPHSPLVNSHNSPLPHRYNLSNNRTHITSACTMYESFKEQTPFREDKLEGRGCDVLHDVNTHTHRVHVFVQ